MMKARFIAVALFIFLSVLIGGYSPAAHAGGTIVGVAGASCSSTTNCTITYTVVGVGNLLALGVGWITSGVVRTITVSDTLGHTWANTISADNTCSGTNHYDSQVFYTTSISTGADTITVTASGSTSKIDAQVFEVSGGLNAPASVGTGHGDCINNVSPSAASTAFTGTVFLFTALETSGTSGLNSAGASYTCLVSATNVCNVGNLLGDEYSIAGVTSPTTFPYGNGAPVSHWSEVGVVFEAAVVVTVTTVVPCTWYEEQCWLFPLFFIAVYSISWLVPAAFSKVSTRGMTHLFMAALTLGTVIDIMMGMLSANLLILLIAIDVLYGIGVSALF